jgi:hypothetical protein
MGEVIRFPKVRARASPPKFEKPVRYMTASSRRLIWPASSGKSHRQVIRPAAPISAATPVATICTVTWLHPRNFEKRPIIDRAMRTNVMLSFPARETALDEAKPRCLNLTNTGSR